MIRWSMTGVLLFLLSACNFSEDYQLAKEVDPLSGDTLYADVQTYTEFGNHRAGGQGDHATTDWMSKKMSQAGFEIRLDPIRFNRFDLEEARFELNGESLECLPFWYPTVTDEPITAPLAIFDPESPGDMTGKIALITGPDLQFGFDPTDWAITAQASGVAALAIIMPHPAGLVNAQNAHAPFNQVPRGIPVMNVAQKHEALLREAAEAGHEVTLEIRGTSNPNARTHNLVATRENGPEWIVVTTPLTGWYTCGGERGPGVALFLGLARWIADQDLPYSLMFLGNAGHELDQIGAGTTLEKNAPAVEDVKVWLHLGASIATRDAAIDENGDVKLLDTPFPQGNLVSTEGLLDAVTDAFSDVDFLKPRTTEPIHGELKDFMEAGYNAFGFFGGCPYFHTPYDTAESTSPELLAQVAAALQQFFETQLPKL